MKDLMTSFEYDLRELDRSEWLERLDDICEEHGYFEPISPNHSAALIDGGKTLIVSFESVDIIRANPRGAVPIGWQYVQSNAWSSLTVLAENNQDWYRHPAVFGYFDRLIDDGFFDDFEQVLFYGAGPAGYAAAAFSVAAPGANVLIIQPQATLDRALTPWDRRFPAARRLDFDSRFGFAPAMCETARNVYVIHDPMIIEDAVHAQMFDAPNTARLSCTNIGTNADVHLRDMNIMEDLILRAADSTLTPQAFAKLWRERRNYTPYARKLFKRLDEAGRHPRLLASLCQRYSDNGRRPMFTRKFEELEQQGVNL